jgi:hypothetical protein
MIGIEQFGSIGEPGHFMKMFYGVSHPHPFSVFVLLSPIIALLQK